MSWTLVNEYGLVSPRSESAPREALSFPVALEQGADGSYLIVDEVGLRKNLTTLTECRTLRVGADKEVLFDSQALGLSDAFGCLAGDHLALLRRTRWELEIRTLSGSLVERFDLSRFTKRMPRLLAWTRRGTFLVSAIDSLYDNDILEIDSRGRLLWFLPQRDAMGCPTSLQLLDNDGILLADEFGHVAIELDRNGSRVWQYGRKRHPARAPGCLSNPMAATEAPDGRRLVADMRNHRILRIEGSAAEPLDLGVALCCPSNVAVTDGGQYLICDAGNERVLALDESRGVVWQYGTSVSKRRSLSFPRSVALERDGSLLVADTGNDRLVSLGESGAETEIALDERLFWPRCVRRTAEGNLLVADARHSRIVELAPSGLKRELRRLRGAGFDALDDPHEVRPLPEGGLLIADAGQHLVVETNWEGDVLWAADGNVGLKDPHSAQKLDNGQVLVSDTGGGRLVWIDAAGRVVREVEAFRTGAFEARMSSPRYAEISPEGILLVVDSGNDRVLAVAENGELLWSLSEISGSAISRLGQPRWAQLLSDGDVVVSDFFHHRVLRLRQGSGSE